MTKLIPLRCPYCGLALEVETSYDGEHMGYECESGDCYASWDKDGNPERGPLSC